MAFSVNEIRAQMALGGARPSLFSVQMTNPIDTSGDQKLTFMCRAASLPSWNLSVIEVPYFGRKIKLPGTRDFDAWDIQVYNDEDYLVRNALETWSNAINSLEGNLDTTNSAAPTNYKTQATVTSYGKTGNVLRVYQFNGIWPSKVADVELDWDAGDQIMAFGVTLQYDDFVVNGGATGSAGGS